MAFQTTYNHSFTNYAGTTTLIEFQEDVGGTPTVETLPFIGKDCRVHWKFSHARGYGPMTLWCELWFANIEDATNGYFLDYVLGLTPDEAQIKISIAGSELCTLAMSRHSLRRHLVPQSTIPFRLEFRSALVKLKDQVSPGFADDQSVFEVMERTLETVGGYSDTILAHPWNSTAWTPGGTGNSDAPMEDLYFAQAKWDNYTYADILLNVCASLFACCGWSKTYGMGMFVEYLQGAAGLPFPGRKVGAASDVTITPPTIEVADHSRYGRASVGSIPPYRQIANTLDGAAANYSYLADLDERFYLTERAVYDIPLDPSAKASVDTDGLSILENAVEYAAGQFENWDPVKPTSSTAQLDECLSRRMEDVFSSAVVLLSGYIWQTILDPMIPFLFLMDGDASEKVFRCVQGFWDIREHSTWLDDAIQIGETRKDCDTFTATAAGGYDIDLAWTWVAVAGHPTPDQYRVQHKGPTQTEWENIYQGSGTSDTYTALVYGTHEFRVRAEHTGDSLYSDWIEADETINAP